MGRHDLSRDLGHALVLNLWQWSEGAIHLLFLISCTNLIAELIYYTYSLIPSVCCYQANLGRQYTRVPVASVLVATGSKSMRLHFVPALYLLNPLKNFEMTAKMFSIWRPLICRAVSAPLLKVIIKGHNSASKTMRLSVALWGTSLLPNGFSIQTPLWPGIQIDLILMTLIIFYYQRIIFFAS